ncbi:MAG: DUF6242 domain-containing protein [Tannerellaceae bacterium]|jgi:hypothetical protein|nr:DUF6242 domain-containing protein [Tannerellaceae bacterium]
MRKVLKGEKTGFGVAMVGVAMAGVLGSCLGGNEEEYEVEIPRDCQVAVLTLSHDSIPALGGARFTIDQRRGEIFNMDSLPCGTEIPDKVACTLQTVNVYAVSRVRMVAGVTGDTVTLKSKTESNVVKWTAEDSVDFSQPVEIILDGIDGVTTRRYSAWVNIHQQEPEAMSWELVPAFAGMTGWEWGTAVAEGKYWIYVRDDVSAIYWYTSPVGDGKSWTMGRTRGLEEQEVCLEQLAVYEGAFYLVSEAGLLTSADGKEWAKAPGGEDWRYLLGSVGGSSRQPACLAGIAMREEGEFFVSLSEGGFASGSEGVPEAFPRTGFSSTVIPSQAGVPYLLVAGGRGANGGLSAACWGSSDGIVWAKLTGEESGFSAREGAALVYYDEKCWLIGGRTAEDENSRDLYVSHDRGLHWSAPAVTVLPDYFSPRPFATAYPSGDGALLLFTAPEVWRGGLNRLLW